MKFWKMNGAGNDFIVINNIEENIPEECLPAIAEKLCHRHMSIGADGFMVVTSSSKADYKMLFYNSDGSLGEMCGNGARCICRYGYENGLAGDTQTVETTAGIVTGYRIDKRSYRVRLNDPTTVKIDMEVQSLGKKYRCSYVELGNPGLPHAVVNIPGLRTKTFDELRELGKSLRYNEAFPKGANVNFYDIDDLGIIEKTYERGVEDFTYACGTGTGAVVLTLTMTGAVEGQNVKVTMTGGDLYITVDMKDGKVENLWLTGPTNIVATGEVRDEELVTV